MFEVGKKYQFVKVEGGDECSFQGVVEAYDHPLIKLARSEPVTIVIRMADSEGGDKEHFRQEIPEGPPGQIINVTSTLFVSAQEIEEKE